MKWSAISLKAFTQPLELFQVRPPFAWELRPLYFSFLVALLVIGLVTPFLYKWLRDEVRKPIVSVAWTNFCIGFVLYFLRDSRVPVLGMDIWRLVQYIGLGIWLIFYIRHLRLTVAPLTLSEEVQARKQKYLPKAKKKS